MIEIKYRAFDKSENKYQVCGSVLIGSHGEPLSLVPSGTGFYSVRLRENVIIELYTGLKDKNGAEIYEGDIIQFQSTEGQGLIKKVCFCDKKCSLMIGNLTYENLTESGFFQPSKLIFELIGNIHENPDLLNI